MVISFSDRSNNGLVFHHGQTEYNLATPQDMIARLVTGPTAVVG